MGKWKKRLFGVFLTVILQLGIYVYLDRVLFAPTASFHTTEAEETPLATNGKVYYSADHSYMAVVESEAVRIYSMPGKKLVHTVPLGSRKVSYFKWLEDRNMALMGLSVSDNGNHKVILMQINPLRSDAALSTTIDKLPKDSKITDVAYSTATNVVYLQVQTVSTPVPLYRVYRTDANYDLQRIYFNTERIGRIGILSDQDSLVFEDLKQEAVMIRHGNGSWQAISPSGGRFRLVGVAPDNQIYIVRLNDQKMAVTVLHGNGKGNFTVYRQLNVPVEPDGLTLNDVLLTN